jgi:hypothetical protein
LRTMDTILPEMIANLREMIAKLDALDRDHASPTEEK